MVGTGPSCIGECFVFSPGIDGDIVTSAMTANAAPKRLRESTDAIDESCVGPAGQTCVLHATKLDFPYLDAAE